jgi:hypothetical protein
VCTLKTHTHAPSVLIHKETHAPKPMLPQQESTIQPGTVAWDSEKSTAQHKTEPTTGSKTTGSNDRSLCNFNLPCSATKQTAQVAGEKTPKRTTIGCLVSN